MPRTTLARLPFLLLGVFSLLAGLWAGLLRLGWGLPSFNPMLSTFHGPILVSGFLGTLIALERAVAVKKLWALAAPFCTGLGSLILILGFSETLGRTLLTGGSLGLAGLYAAIFNRPTALYKAVMQLGALAWFFGNALLLSGWPSYGVVFWWVAFLVFTIAGERLELSRLLKIPRSSWGIFAAAAAAVLAGLVAIALAFSERAREADWTDRLFEGGVRLAGFGMAVMAAWLIRHDMARKTVRQPGLSRFMALSLLAGHSWLGIGGLLALSCGAVTSGSSYDAMLHSIFLGFAMSMVFGHAPVIFTGVLGALIPFRRAFYSHLLLLHASLLFRVASDLADWLPGRQWAGIFNALAILLFLANTAAAIRRGQRAP